MGHVNAYIRQRYQYDEYRRMHIHSNDIEIRKELEEKVFKPEYYHIVVLGRSVYTIYTNSRRYVNWWISLMKRRYIAPNQRTIGLDIQLLEDRTDKRYPPLSTIQLCIRNQCLIYHMYLSNKLPRRLERFLTDPRNTFLCINLQYELLVLKYWTRHTGRIRYRDLAFLAFPDGVREDTGITAVVARLLRQDLVLPDVDLDWDFHTLTDDQIIYASAFAYLSYRCGFDPFPVAN